MSGRIVVCQYCREKTVPWKERFEKMEVLKTVSESGKTKKTLYFHKDKCWGEHLKQQEFIKKEQEEKDELNETIKMIHGIHEKANLPPRIWELIQDLRNGTNRFEKFWKRRYKEGIPYPVLKEAFILSKGDIEWARLNRKFKTDEQALRYSLAIVQSKISDAFKKMKRTEQSKKMADAVEQRQIEHMSEEREVQWKKKDTGIDMSDILGDD